jgi:plasmid maintenance system killer protein
VKIRKFVHKGLNQLYTEGNSKGEPPETAKKLRKMFAFMDSTEDPEELRSLAAWKPHTH